MKRLCFSIFLISLLNNSYGQTISKEIVFIPYNQNHKWGFSSINGEIIINPTFDSVGAYYDGYAEAYKLDKVGYIDKKGKWVVPPIFNGVKLLDKKKKLFEVSIDFRDKDSMWNSPSGIYKQNIGLLTPIKYYSMVEYNSQHYALEGNNGKNYLVDLKTKKITKLRHTDLFECGCGREYKKIQAEELKYKKYLKKRPPLEELNTLYSTNRNNKYGGYFVYDTIFDIKAKKWIKFIDSIPAIYDTLKTIEDYQNELFYVRLKNKWGVVNSKGKEIITPIFDTVYKKNYQPYFTIKSNGKYGIYTTSGNVIFDCLQDKVIIPCDYSSKLFVGKQNGKWTIKNNLGIQLFDNSFDTVKVNCNWNNDCAIIQKDNKFGIVDTNGVLKYSIIYDEIKFQDSFLIYKLNGFWGVRNFRDNKEILKPEWTSISTNYGYYNDYYLPYFIIQKENNFGVYLPVGQRTEKIFYPISKSENIEIPPTNVIVNKQEFLIFGIREFDKFYYVGENYIKYQKD